MEKKLPNVLVIMPVKSQGISECCATREPFPASAKEHTGYVLIVTIL